MPQKPPPRPARPSPGAGEGTGDAKEGARAHRPYSPVTRAAPGRTRRAGGRARSLIQSRPDPGFRPELPRPSHDKGAESGAGRHVTTRRRRLMTPEPALAVSATGLGS
ncbi:hypothetical protein J1605_007553 [Eschrichtius robustus]|uniref:Uncharacterized protein n=1 Tax=Eschrichtius robustus TaxID=9764 RepID=A0AB34GWY8_ESCRO|nr:hypothetical protein J1605_007553 [Eschrichtius robustus]